MFTLETILVACCSWSQPQLCHTRESLLRSPSLTVMIRNIILFALSVLIESTLWLLSLLLIFGRTAMRNLFYWHSLCKVSDRGHMFHSMNERLASMRFLFSWCLIAYCFLINVCTPWGKSGDVCWRLENVWARFWRFNQQIRVVTKSATSASLIIIGSARRCLVWRIIFSGYWRLIILDFIFVFLSFQGWC